MTDEETAVAQPSGSDLLARLRTLPLLDGLPDLADLDTVQVVAVVAGLVAIAAGCVALALSGVNFGRDLILRWGEATWAVPPGIFWVGAGLFVLGFSFLVDGVMQASGWVRWPALALLTAAVVYATGWPPTNPGHVVIGIGVLWLIALFMAGEGPGSILVVAAWVIWYFGLFDLAVLNAIGLRWGAVNVGAIVRLTVLVAVPFLLVAGLDVGELAAEMASGAASLADRGLGPAAGLVLAGAALTVEWRLGAPASLQYLARSRGGRTRPTGRPPPWSGAL